MRTSYPFCAWVLDIMMGREEEGVLDEKQIIEEASIFREDIFTSRALEQQAAVATPEIDSKVEDAVLSEILSSEKDLQQIFSVGRDHK